MILALESIFYAPNWQPIYSLLLNLEYAFTGFFTLDHNLMFTLFMLTAELLLGFILRNEL